MRVIVERSFVHNGKHYRLNSVVDVSEHTAKQWIAKKLVRPAAVQAKENPEAPSKEKTPGKNQPPGGESSSSSQAAPASQKKRSTKSKSGGSKKASKKSEESSSPTTDSK